jgi:hypothetical protein
VITGNSIVLLMSSGNYEGLDIEGFSKKATGATRVKDSASRTNYYLCPF